ncbi:metallophosphoesterase family protein [Kocuria sp. cx-455]|uniref:metallophosphoesterase family protein n=1 Tax=Kocuria sp. cx-455 TaxID=2771377 RepID=UPI003D71910F
MTTSILLLADTHLPKRAKALPDQVWGEVDAADVVIHAGDWVDLDTFEALRNRARRLIAVWGNNDGPELRELMPETVHWDMAGLRWAMTHESGASSGREKRMDKAFPHTDVLIFGHSHIPWDSVSPAGMRLLNPGSPTDRRRQPHCTYMRVTADDGALTAVQLVRLPPRT